MHPTFSPRAGLIAPCGLWLGTVAAGLWASPAFALDTFVGGAASGGVTVGGDGSGGIGVAPTIAQAEIDGRLATPDVYVRVDLDVHVDPANLGDGLAAPVPPEWAMVQFGRQQYHVRLGVTNPNIGLQQWDEWQNYLPSYSIMWGAQPSQILGVEPGIDFDSGLSVFAYGGYDLGWGGLSVVPGTGLMTNSRGLTAGAGFSLSSDGYYAALSAAAYPIAGFDYYAAFGTFELYPMDQLTLSLDGGAGLMGGAPFAGAQLQVIGLPGTIVSPVARFELAHGGGLEGELGALPTATASLGAKVAPCEFATLQVEGKGSFYATGGPQLMAEVLVSVFRPEPTVYSAAINPPDEGDDAK